MAESPTEIREDGTYWLYALEVLEDRKPTGDEHLTRDEYFERHGVTRPQNLTADDLPPAETDAVRELDRAALEETKVGGKWHVAGAADLIEGCWPGIVDDVDDRTIWGAKAMTATGHDAHPGEDHVLVVYTPNYFATDDVDRIRDRLRDAYDLTDELYYKPNVYSAKGIQPDTAADWGLEMPYRYSG